MNRRGQLQRLEALEAARNVHRMYFRTPAGRAFSLDIGDVMAIVMDGLGWLHDPTADPPRSKTLEALATAVPDRELGLIGQTAVLAAQQVMQEVKR
ncbi:MULTISPECIES: hypothetical protein [unclassified Streptomyces]|uniref:hypothetical protein n=1 Tax=unclassified Streptomyces TaxID=2593676 RepID=UPI0004CB7789|nr:MULTISPECIES: hypothetical protein [unclassified Streptomyces]KJY18386.1 hypothetical protein VR43_25185 [Streptomyces sp. NRRL S-104]